MRRTRSSADSGRGGEVRLIATQTPANGAPFFTPKETMVTAAAAAVEEEMEE